MKKVTSVLLVIVLLCSIIPVFDVVSYSAAKDDSAYDCVAYAKARFREIWGFDLHPTGSAGANGYYFNASTYGDVVSSTPRAGALAVWDSTVNAWGHVAIVESVSGSSVTYSEGGYIPYVGASATFNQETRDMSNMSKTNQPFLGYVYVNGTSNLSKPTNGWIKSDKTVAAVGEEVIFTYDATGANTFVMGTYFNDQHYVADLGGNKTHTTKYNKPGPHYVHIACYNSLGYCDTEQIVIYVYDSKPTNGWIESDKTVAAVGEEVTFTYDATGANTFVMGTYFNDQHYVADLGGKKTHTTKYNKPGPHYVHIACYNGLGYCDTKQIIIDVSDSKPSDVKLAINKNDFVAGEKIQFTPSSICSLGYAIGIGKYNESTEKWERIYTGDITGNFEYIIDEQGKYGAYVTAWNNSGYTDSEKVYFTVHDPDETFNVTYDANGGSDAPLTDTKKYNEFLYLSPTEPTRDGYIFLGWSTDKNATEPEYIVGDIYAENEDATLYAVWEEITYTNLIQGTATSFGNGNEEIILKKKDSTQESYAVVAFTNEDTYSVCDPEGKIEPGEYVLSVSKENHVTREYNVTIGDETVTLDIQLNLIGDINGDGKINVMDYSGVLRHAKKTETLEDYAFLCADVDGNGKVTVSDYARILRHVKKIDPLW